MAVASSTSSVASAADLASIAGQQPFGLKRAGLAEDRMIDADLTAAYPAGLIAADFAIDAAETELKA